MLIILDEELDLLSEMQPIDRDLFNYLAERVDYKTGTIGVSRRISYGGMSRDLSESQTERRRPDSLRCVTSKQVENSTNRLIIAGLLERRSKSGFNQPLMLVRVFWAAAVGKGNCAKKPDGSQLGVLMGVLNNLNANINNNLQEKTQTSWEQKPKPVGTTSNIQQQQYSGDEFFMNPEWTPSSDEYEMILLRAGYRVDKVPALWVREFIDHWSCDKSRKYTQAQWTKRLAYKMIGYLRDPGLFDRLHGVGEKSRQAVANPQYPEWARVPNDDPSLVPFMRKHGYGDPPPGVDYRQARALLKRKVDLRLSEWKRGLS